MSAKHFILPSLLFHLLTTFLYCAPRVTDQALADFYLKRAEFLYEKSVYDSLPYYYTEALRISTSMNDTSMIIECFLGFAEYYRLISELDHASSYLEKISDFMDENFHGYPDAMAAVFFIRAKISTGQGDFREALKLVRMASGMNGATNHQKNSRYLNLIGSIHNMDGDFDSAEYYYVKSFREINSITEGPAIEKAWYYLNMSQIYNRRGELDKALDHLQKNVQTTIQLYGDNSPELMNSYMNLGYYYITTGMTDSARIFLNKAEFLIYKDTITGKPLIPSLFESHGNLAYMEGNYPESSEAYYQALLTAIQIYGTNHPLLYRYYNNCANAHRARGNYKDALQFYHRAAEQTEKLHPSRIVSSYFYLATTYAKAGYTREADYYYTRLITGRTKFLGSNHPLLSYDYLSYGDFLTSLGRLKEAKKYLERALDIRLKKFGTKHYLTSESFLFLGRYYQEIKDYEQALSFYQKALIAVVPQYNDPDYNSNPEISDNTSLLIFLKILKDKALLLEKMGRLNIGSKINPQYLTASFHTYQSAVNVILRMQNEWLMEESRLYLSEIENEPFLSLIRLSLDLYDSTGKDEYLNEGFVTAEKMKYSTLLATLRDQKAINDSKVPEDLRIQDHQIRMELSFYKDLVEKEYKKEAPDSIKISNWNRKIYELNNDRKELIRHLSKKFPEYYSLKYFPGVMSIKSVQKRLDIDDLMMEYVLSDSTLIIFALERYKLTCRRIGIDSSFFKNTGIIYDFTRHDYFNTSSEQIPAFIHASFELYKCLFGNDKLEDGKRLIIVPDGLLAYIPFDVLITDPVEGNEYNFGKLAYLLKKHPLSYAYSATLLFQSDSRKARAKKELLAYAPSDPETGRLYSNPPEVEDQFRSNLKPLAGSVKEVRSILQIVGGDVRIGNEASEKSFKELVSQYRILHLAVHTFVDEEDPMNSTLVFSPGNEGGEDGLLTVSEIYSLDLSARMVVLSACNTGYGKLKKGEGIMSLARAFFYAGASDVVMTLWPVGDESCARLMTDFYQNLAKGKTKDIALRNAKLMFMKEADPMVQHPFYWAGYMVMGDRKEIFSPAIIKYLIMGIFLILLIPVYIYKNKIFKKTSLKERLQVF